MASVLADLGGFSLPFFIVAAMTLLVSACLWLLLPSTLDNNNSNGKDSENESEKDGKQLGYSSLLKVNNFVFKLYSTKAWLNFCGATQLLGTITITYLLRAPLLVPELHQKPHFYSIHPYSCLAWTFW